MGTLIGTIITGAIIGAIARFFMRGRQNIFASLDHCLRRYRRGYRQLGGCSAGRCRNGWHRLDAWDSSVFAAMLTISLYLGMTGRK